MTIQQKIKEKVTAIMARQDPHPVLSVASGLLVISWLYGVCMRLRRFLFDIGFFTSHRLPCYVISVGNLCLGGTGKTPMALHLAELLGELGYKPAIVSRGYKGFGEEKGAVVSDGRRLRCDVRQSGDEPFLLASMLKGVPVVVGRNRVSTGQTALKRFQPDALILDDGFQHLCLQRDLNLLLLDARNPFGNSFVLPRGSLREPKSALSRADAVVLTRCNHAAPSSGFDLINAVSPRPVFRAFHQSVLRGILPAGQNPDMAFLERSNPGDLKYLKGRRVFAFSGLAHNNAFWDGLHEFGAQLQGTLGFEDHHPYNLTDAEGIVRAASLAGGDCLITTDKDYVRLPQLARFSMDLIVMGIRIDFGEDLVRWRRFIAERTGAVLGDKRFR